MIKLNQMNWIRSYDSYVDICKSKSKCRKCEGAIMYGEERFVIVFNHSWVSFQNGGGKKQTRLFLHPSCAGVPTGNGRTCSICGGYRNWSVGGEAERCVECVLTDPFYMFCDFCNSGMDRSNLSRIVKADGYISELDRTMWACPRCESFFAGGIVTERTIGRAERAERAMMRRLVKVKRDIESWDYEREERV